MRESVEELQQFIRLLQEHAIRKAALYDGTDTMSTPDECLRFAIEELGELSGAITRSRFELAKCEAIDVAHCAMLVWLALQRTEEK